MVFRNNFFIEWILTNITAGVSTFFTSLLGFLLFVLRLDPVYAICQRTYDVGSIAFQWLQQYKTKKQYKTKTDVNQKQVIQISYQGRTTSISFRLVLCKRTLAFSFCRYVLFRIFSINSQNC